MAYSSLLMLVLALQPDPAALVPLYREALERREKQFGSEHPKTARSASDLGLYLKKLGQNDQALVYLRRALEIDSKLLDSSDPVLAEDMEHVAALVGGREAQALLT